MGLRTPHPPEGEGPEALLQWGFVDPGYIINMSASILDKDMWYEIGLHTPQPPEGEGPEALLQWGLVDPGYGKDTLASVPRENGRIAGTTYTTTAARRGPRSSLGDTVSVLNLFYPEKLMSDEHSRNSM